MDLEENREGVRAAGSGEKRWQSSVITVQWKEQHGSGVRLWCPWLAKGLGWEGP